MIISWQKAQKLLFERVRVIEIEKLQIAHAAGRCLAKDVLADRDFPPMDLSAMDGFALQCADLTIYSSENGLKIDGESAAGIPYSQPIKPGACVRIMTGAVVPAGADAVVRQEDVSEKGGRLYVSVKPSPGENIRRRGEDARHGDVILRRGSVLSPVGIGICAGAGMVKVDVFKNPRIAVICSGSEISVDEHISPERLRDTNGPLLAATLLREFAVSISPSIVPDENTILRNALTGVLDSHDVIIVTGGVSVGKYDLIPNIIRDIGAEIVFHGLAIKPGKPQLYANFNGKHIFGLPGNPLGVISGLHLFVLPALRLMTGATTEKCLRLLRLPFFGKTVNRRNITEFRLGRLVTSSEGTRVQLVNVNGSADLISAANADGFIILESGRAVEENEIVDFIPWEGLDG